MLTKGMYGFIINLQNVLFIYFFLHNRAIQSTIVQRLKIVSRGDSKDE